MSLQLIDQQPSHCWVTSADHGQTVTPAGPICWRAGSCGASQTNPSQHPGQGTEILRLPILGQGGLQDLLETLPDANVVGLAKRSCTAWLFNPRHAIGPGRRTMQQEQPRRLDIWNQRNPLQQRMMSLDGALLMSPHEICVSARDLVLSLQKCHPHTQQDAILRAVGCVHRAGVKQTPTTGQIKTESRLQAENKDQKQMSARLHHRDSNTASQRLGPKELSMCLHSTEHVVPSHCVNTTPKMP